MTDKYHAVITCIIDPKYRQLKPLGYRYNFYLEYFYMFKIHNYLVDFIFV